MINSYILKILNSYIRFSILRFSILPRRPIKKPAVEAGFGIIKSYDRLSSDDLFSLRTGRYDRYMYAALLLDEEDIVLCFLREIFE